MSNKYSELSDFEINKLVAERLGFAVADPADEGYNLFDNAYRDECPDAVWISKNSKSWDQTSYVSCDATCMPIAWENKIGTEHKANGDWIAAITGERDAFGVPVRWAHWSESNNPRRAICECFLLMGDAEIE